MSTNGIHCIINKRIGTDLLYDTCRIVNRENRISRRTDKAIRKQLARGRIIDDGTASREG